MNYPEYWTKEEVDRFYAWVAAHPAFRGHISQTFPDLENELKTKGLEPSDAEELAKYLKWLSVLPYADRMTGCNLLVFNYTEFKGISRSLKTDCRGARLCALFRVLARMMFQGASTFPASSAKLAAELMKTLRCYPHGARRFEPLADLLVDSDGCFLHGANAEELTRDQVNRIIQSEHFRLAAMFEDIYSTKAKFDGFRVRLRENREFRRDWDILKTRFPKTLGKGNKVLRSELERETLPKPVGLPSWRSVFDFFCWKWFLDGMEGGEPIVMKLSFEITPFGTTIFIPGYWSFDPKRDIKWTELLSFHQSRGVVKRQGVAFEEKRRRREEKERNVQDAEDASRALDEKGEPRIERSIRMANLPQGTDPAQVYRLARAANKKGRGSKNRRPPIR